MKTIFDELDYTFVSNDFNITTPAILTLQKSVMKWIADGTPGAIIYGRPRIGKTRAIFYIASVLKARYGRELPIYVLNSTDHVAKDKYFYSELLKTVGHPEYEKGTVSALKERLINSFINSACSTKYQKIVLFIDEAYHFTEKDFNWLMDIYNNLYLRNIHMTVFLVGSEELKARKQAFIMAKQHQIVGRFMVDECHFHGIQSAKDISICLYNFDNQYNINDKASLIFAKEFFPNAYADGKRLSECSDDIMNEYIDVMKEIGIPTTSEIPMMYFINTVKYCLKTFGKSGSNIYFPDTAAWNESIRNSGYVAAERIYYNVPIG